MSGCARKKGVGESKSQEQLKDTIFEVAPKAPPPPSGYVRKYTASEFGEFFEGFFYAFAEKNEWALDMFIHPGHGVIVIDANGALPQIHRTHSFSQIKKLGTGKSIFEYDGYLCSKLIVDTLPVVDCNSPTFYSKQGCFTWNVNALANSSIEDVATFSNVSKEEFEFIVNTIQWTTVNTSNFTFYWSLIDGFWYLSVIDVRRPCEA